MFLELVLFVVCSFHTASIVGYDSSITLPWSWNTVPLWADFYIRNGQENIITDWRAEFIANHYSVISMEKCYSSKTWPWGHAQQAFYEAASVIRRYGSSDQIRILFYWNVDAVFCDCYVSTPGVSEFCSNSTNNPNGDSRPQYDHSKPYVRKWWIDTLMLCIRGAFEQDLIIDGVFLDGTNVHSNANIALLLTETRQAFLQYGTDLFIMGNGLWNYNFWPSHNVESIPYVDGMCVEHFAAFEELKHTATGSSFDPDKLLVWFDLIPAVINGKYGANKSIFIKAIIGPATQRDGQILWPTWYERYPFPSTTKEWQNVSAQLITFPFAVYLCGVLYENVYFSYGWWYSIDHGFVPCPESPSSCFSPLDWYPEFTNDLGKPLSNPIMTDKYKCNRSFEHAHVYVDLSDDTSGIIQWIPPTPLPTSSPTYPSTAPTEISISPTEYPSGAPTLSIIVMKTASDHQSGMTGLMIQTIVVMLLVLGCVGYFCYKTRKMESNVGDINTDYKAI